MGDEGPERVRKAADGPQEYAEATEQIGRPPDAALAQVTAPRVVYLQPKEFGGDQSHLCDVLGAAMAVPLGSGLGGSVTSFRMADSFGVWRVAGRRATAATNASS